MSNIVVDFETFDDSYRRMDRRLAAHVVKYSVVKDQRLFDLIVIRYADLLEKAKELGERSYNVTIVGEGGNDSRSSEIIPASLPRVMNQYLDELGVPDSLKPENSNEDNPIL